MGNVENILDRLVNIQGDVVEMLKGQRQEILEMKRFNQQTRQRCIRPSVDDKG